MQFRHHGLYLTAVKHPHQNGFDHIIVVVTEGDFIAAKFFCLMIERPAPHSGAVVAGRSFSLAGDDVENFRGENGNRDVHELCVIENRLIVCLVIARVHHQINDFEILFAVAVKLLKEFRH